MIRPAEAAQLAALRTCDPFFTRIFSLYECYGAGYGFTDFWVQETEGAPVSAVSRFEDKFSLYLTDGSDLEEVAAFLRFQGAGSVMFDARYDLEIYAESDINGKVLAYRGENYISDLEIYTPDLKALYELLKTCESEIFRVPPMLSFLSDVTHRTNMSKCTILAIGEDSPVSSVMTVSETRDAAILGAVATHPDHRRRGLSRELVRTLASRITGEGRAACVFSASDANTRFYENAGFEIIAGFRELFLN